MTAAHEESPALHPFPPPGARTRAPPHVVRLRSPEPRALPELLRRVEEAEAHHRGELALVEDNAWMTLALFHWNQVVSIDPNVDWAEEASREIILRHEDRDRTMLLRAKLAHRRIALDRYRSRVAGIYHILNQELLAQRPAVENDERVERAEIARLEKVNRPWMSSLLSPRRRGVQSPSFAGQNPTTPVQPPEPPKITQPAFSRYLGRELWAREKRQKYDRMAHTRRFERAAEEEEAARGAVEADEALAFMRLHQCHLEERFTAHRDYVTRRQEESLGLQDDQLSEATLQRRRTDAARRIQRFGRSINQRLQRALQTIDSVRTRTEDRGRSASRIQCAERHRQARKAVARRLASVNESIEQRAIEEQKLDSAEENGAPTARAEEEADGSSAGHQRETTHVHRPKPVGIEAEEVFASSKPMIMAESPNETPRPARRKSEVVDNNYLSLDARPAFSRTSSMRSTPLLNGQAPWEAATARLDLVGLKILAKAVFSAGGGSTELQPALRPLWRACGFALSANTQSSPGRTGSFVGKAGGYSMLDLLCSTLEPDKRGAMSGLQMVVEGLYGATERAPIAHLPLDGLYPHMEHLFKTLPTVHTDASTSTETPSSSTAAVAAVAAAAEAEGQSGDVKPVPRKWCPERTVTRASLQEFWSTANHHRNIKNAIELTPPRWEAYDRADLEAEERVQLENSEMLRREQWIEEQLDDAFGVVCVFYMSSGAPLRPPSARTR